MKPNIILVNSEKNKVASTEVIQNILGNYNVFIVTKEADSPIFLTNDLKNINLITESDISKLMFEDTVSHIINFEENDISALQYAVYNTDTALINILDNDSLNKSNTILSNNITSDTLQCLLDNTDSNSSAVTVDVKFIKLTI